MHQKNHNAGKDNRADSQLSTSWLAVLQEFSAL